MKENKFLLLLTIMLLALMPVFSYQEVVLDDLFIENKLFNVYQINGEGIQYLREDYSVMDLITVRFDFITKPVRKFGHFSDRSKLCVGSVGECEFNCVPIASRDYAFSGCLGQEFSELPLGAVDLEEFWVSKVELNNVFVEYRNYSYDLWGSDQFIEGKVKIKLKKISNWGRELITILRNNTCHSVSYDYKISDFKVLDASVECCKNKAHIKFLVPKTKTKEVDRRFCTEGFFRAESYEDFSFSVEFNVDSYVNVFRKKGIFKFPEAKEICDGRCNCFTHVNFPGLVNEKNKSYFINHSTGWYSGECEEEDVSMSSLIITDSMSSFQVLGLSLLILFCFTGLVILSLLVLLARYAIWKIVAKRRERSFALVDSNSSIDNH